MDTRVHETLSLGKDVVLEERMRRCGITFVRLTEQYPSIGERGEIAVAPVLEAAKQYEEKGIDTRSDIFEHGLRTVGNLMAFARERIPLLNCDIAMLHDLIDRAWNTQSDKYNPDRSQAAKDKLRQAIVSMNLTDEQLKYFVCIASDLIGVENESGEHRKAKKAEASMGGHSNGLPDNYREIISDKYQGKISPEVWGLIEPYLDFKHMGEILYSNNIEGFLIKASELIDNIRNPSSKRESAWLQDVLEAESFLAPILEVLGLDGLASVLRSEAHKCRLTMSGNGKYIAQAEAKLKPIRNIGVDRIAEEVFGEGAYTMRPVVGQDIDGETPILIGDIEQHTESKIINRGRYRLKTDGSLANKLYRDQQKRKESPESDMHMDIFGMTIVSKGVEASATAFADFATERLLNEKVDNLTPQKSPSKKKALYVGGSENFVERVRSILEQRGIADKVQFEIESKEVAKGRACKRLKVAKATFMTTVGEVKVPTEIQFVTKKERKRMRKGEIAHIVYKYIEAIERGRSEPLARKERKAIIKAAKKVMKLMNFRKNHLSPDSYDVNERSLPGGRALYADLFGEEEAQRLFGDADLASVQ